ncbi:MAG: glycoside hydrolase family 9 protein [Phycisphaerae bacterium]
MTRAGLILRAAAVVLAPIHALADAWLRVNQVGYLPDDSKVAILSSEHPLAGPFRVGTFTADIGSDTGAWGPFRHNYRLDFSRLRTPGRYVVEFERLRSPEFRIGADTYNDCAARLMDFVRLQRCGANPVTGRDCHQQDAIDVDSRERVDLTGGWHDAADRIKHMLTTSYCVAALFLAGETAEARYGADLLIKIHPRPNTIYLQVGDDRDHLPPEKLWHDDQSDYGWGPGGPRAAWPATGRPQGSATLPPARASDAGPTGVGPQRYQNESSGLANLAGRTAAALALAGDVERAASAYRLARRLPGCAMSAPVRAPYYYRESDYFDDLEWGAIELYIATRNADYLRQAGDYAARAGESAWMGRGRHGHYEFFPYVNLAHWRLHAHADESTRGALAGYYRAGLERVRERALANAYRLGTPLVWCSTNDVIAFATQALLYERMSGDPRFRELATEARDWIFGRNPWGVSFVVGVPVAGDAVRRPHHLFWKLEGKLPVGGLVDGPVYRDINEGLKFTPWGADRLARFQSDVGVYHDVFEDFSTNEPILDGTVALRLLLALGTDSDRK